MQGKRPGSEQIEDGPEHAAKLSALGPSKVASHSAAVAAESVAELTPSTQPDLAPDPPTDPFTAIRPRRRADQRAPTDIDAHVGRRLRERRLLLGLTIQALAKTIGLTFQQLQKYECAANRISASRLYQLSQELRVPIAWFYDGADVRHSDDGEASDPPPPVDDPEILRFIHMYHRIKSEQARRCLRSMASTLADQR
jgi:transcriptional regulator with XRE-family HTH domain